MNERYDHNDIEKKWQDIWSEQSLYETEDISSKEKCYVLDMFPYPSGEGLHVGHPRGYIATDIYSRMKRMQGYNVLHPMGWDAFGLPAENFAIKNKVHPSIAVEKNVARFKEQLSLIGPNYDWSHEINTTDPEFYKWTQWIFLKMYEKGLAYESHEPINWCPTCKTGLANEDVESDGTCERCDSAVEKKPMRQWVLKITDYADRLISDLDTLSKWPEGVKEAQRHWIGRSEGSEFEFAIEKSDMKVIVFTTRAETLFGVTYIVLAPEGDYVQSLKGSIKNWSEVEAFIKDVENKKDIERTAEGKEKNGVRLEGITALHPATKEQLPVWIGDYVLAGYGTGAVMAVPAHDERDFAFAEKYSLPSIDVVSTDDVLVNSADFNDLNSLDAKEKITEKYGRVKVTYRLKDWVFSRQRYWGEPIPLIHCEDCGVMPVPEKDLPVVLPQIENYEPTGTGESPLADIEEWVHVNCPKCSGKAKRETNTMPQWAGSSWYYLRYIDPVNSDALISKEKEKYWSPVDVYVGGDHATRHLIYARFWHKFLFDIGVVSHDEPFPRLEFLGFILAEDGRKMSKRWGNVINPDDMISRFGADAFRLYEMFIGPFENTVPWSTDGLVGTRRFLEKVWRLSFNLKDSSDDMSIKALHKTIKKVTEDIENFKFNTAVSECMIAVNLFEKNSISRDDFKIFLRILAPFAPHMCEEIYHDVYKEEGSVHVSSWPSYDESNLTQDTVQLPVQFMGKVRGTLEVEKTIKEEDVLSLIRETDSLSKYLTGDIKRVIYVPGKIINIIL
ncbi:MAG: leucyl-tRNA synthetase [Flavobacteriaceae bacterium]|jgi:leucyl-tRNA synthetase